MNRLEELGRVDAEKAKTKMGKRNLRDEKSRIIRELKADGGKVKKKKSRKNPMKDDRAREGLKSKYRKMGMGKMIDSGEIDFSEYKAGGRALKPVKPSQKGLKKLPTKVRNKMGYMKKGGKVGMGKAMRGGGCVR
jgi:hypothetical protein